MLDVMSDGRLIAGMVIGGGPEYFTYQSRSDHRPREVPRGARPDRQGVDDAGAVPVELEALLLPLRQSLADAAAEAAPADLDSRRRQPGDHRVRGPAALSLHGHSVFPHRRLSPGLRPVPRGLPEGGLHRRPGADGLGRADLRGRDRQAGPRGVRAALLVLRHESAQGHRPDAAGLHVAPSRRRRSSRTSKYFLYQQKTWDDIENGVFAIVGSPETVRQKLAHYQKELGAGVVLTGCQTGTLPHHLAQEHGAAGPRSAAEGAIAGFSATA